MGEVSAAAMTAVNPAFPDPRRRRAADPVYDAIPTLERCIIKEVPVSDAAQTDDARTALARGAMALSRTASLDETLAELCDALLSGSGADSAAVVIADPDRRDLEVGAAVGLDADGLASLATSVADRDHAIAVAARGGVAVWGAESFVPLTVGSDGTDAVIGAIAVTWSSGPPDAERRELVGAFANLIAVGIDRARLGSMASERSEWFERMAHLDPLTGLANNRTFGRMLELEIVRAGRQGGEVSLAVFDVDGFKAANDAGGHAVGDDILRRVAAVIAESVRLVDTVARYGGDEFIVVAPGSGGGAVARRILAAVAALPPVANRSITVSAGLARFPADGTTGDELLVAAEHALAGAKAAGGGTIAEASSLAT